jgi:hypothetical protein
MAALNIDKHHDGKRKADQDSEEPECLYNTC